MASTRVRHSWPFVTRKTAPIFSKRYFEAEDVVDIPEHFRWTPEDLKSPNHRSLRLVLDQCKELGRDYVTIREAPHTTISQRQATYTDNWRGPPSDVMAECGLYQLTHDTAQCYSCNLRFRDLNDPEICVWTRHCHFAPNCSHVQRAKKHGRPMHGGFRRSRRFSTDGAMTLM